MIIHVIRMVLHYSTSPPENLVGGHICFSLPTPFVELLLASTHGGHHPEPPGR